MGRGGEKPRTQGALKKGDGARQIAETTPLPTYWTRVGRKKRRWGKGDVPAHALRWRGCHGAHLVRRMVMRSSLLLYSVSNLHEYCCTK